jgi:hypothetical protein
MWFFPDATHDHDDVLDVGLIIWRSYSFWSSGRLQDFQPESDYKVIMFFIGPFIGTGADSQC